MQLIEQNGYSKEKILEQLHFKYGSNTVKFKYDLLDKNEIKIGTLDNVISGEISMASLAQIKRTARFSIIDKGNIDWLNDRIQPIYMLKMPDGGWVKWSLGIFIPSTPSKTETGGVIYREVEAYDGLVVLKDDKFSSRYVIPGGTNYSEAIYQLLFDSGIQKINIDITDKILPSSREFEIGTEILSAVNQLLSEINYTTLTVDEYGYYTSKKYISPSDRVAEYTYADDELSILSSGINEELDIFGVPNIWVVVVSNPELEPLISVYENNNPESITSTISRDRNIVDYREIDSIADQSSLDDYVKRIANNASQVYGHVIFETALNPLHSYSDVLNLKYGPLSIDDKFSETKWTLPLQAGAKMVHEVRRVVSI